MFVNVRPIRKKQSSCHYAHKYLREYCQKSNIHGVYYLTEERCKAEKVFWCFILLLSLSGCSFMIHKIWHKYKANPIVVSFGTEDQSIYEIPFPAVTICPESKCVQSKFNYSSIYEKLFNNESISETDYRIFFYLNIVCTNDEEDFPYPKKNITVDDDFFSVINEMKPELGMSCDFFEIDSCDEHFTPIITDQGICYSINLLKKSEIFRSNVVYPDNFYFNELNSSEYDVDTGYHKNARILAYPFRAFIAGIENSVDLLLIQSDLDRDNKCSFLQGYRLMLHDPLDFPRMSKNYISVSHNKQILIAVQPQVVKTSYEVIQFHPEIRKCYMKHEKFLKYFLVYSQSNCQLECFTNFTLETCGCIYYYMPRENQTSICGATSYDCLDEATIQFKIKEVESKSTGTDKYLCDCRPTCNSLRYDVEVSQSDIYYQSYFANLFKNKSLQKMLEMEKYSHIKIYFKSDHFMLIERKELYGVSDLISSFGGLLGLFTGFSLISAVEIIYFMTLRPLCNIKIFGRWWGSTY